MTILTILVLGILGGLIALVATARARTFEGSGVLFFALGFVFIGGIGTIVLRVVANHLVDFWLYQTMGYASVWLQRFEYQWGLFFAGFVISFALIAVNLTISAKAVPASMQPFQKWIILIIATLVAYGFAVQAHKTWDEILLYLNAVPTGRVDPLFHRDVSWYMFSFPFLNRLKGWLMVLTVITAVLTGFSYGAQAAATNNKFDDSMAFKHGLRHIGYFVAIFMGLLAWHWVLRRQFLPVNPWANWGYAGSEINGAAYVDVTISSVALLFMPWLSLAVGLFALFAVYRDNIKPFAGASALYVLFMVIGLWAVPGITYAAAVRPNELGAEAKYIQWDNRGSLSAVGLNGVQTEDFAADPITADQLAANEDIVENLRFLDPGQVFKPNTIQLQEVRNYYDFTDADIGLFRDESGNPQQVMLAARELCTSGVPNQTWINTHLVYTHGRGIAAADVNEFDAQGNMRYLTSGIPGSGQYAPQQEAIYYGECTDTYVFTSTAQAEVGPPKSGGGWEPVEYDGEGGVEIGSFGRRFLFALSFGDFTLLRSNQLSNDSIVHYRRNIKTRVGSIAPFLWLDYDPFVFPARGEASLQWMLDANTTSRYYPYADNHEIEGIGTRKYVSPSVKVTVDAYDGTPNFYLLDPSDPVAATWAKIHPDLFQDFDEMPSGIAEHARFPEDAFVVQAKALEKHHMTDAQALFSNEDLWVVAGEQIGGQITVTAPRYVLTRLPGEKELEYVLVWSYNRAGRDNGVAMVVARSGENYGDVIIYRYPTNKTVIGMGQFESVLTSSQLGSQLTLLDQGGKKVIRGNVILLPVEDSLLYTEAIYVQSTTTSASGSNLSQLEYYVVGSSTQCIGFSEVSVEAAIQNYSQRGCDNLDGQTAVTVDTPGVSVTTPITATGSISGTVGTQPSNCQILWSEMETHHINQNVGKIVETAGRIIDQGCN